MGRGVLDKLGKESRLLAGVVALGRWGKNVLKDTAYRLLSYLDSIACLGAPPTVSLSY